MTVLVCYNEGVVRHMAPLRAFAEGMKKHGHIVHETYSGNTHFKLGISTELVVIFGSGSLTRGANAMFKYHIIEKCKNLDIPYVMLEEAYIDRGTYWSVTLNGLAGDGEYLHDNLDPDRINDVVDFKPFHWSGNTILLTKQLERDANVGVPPEDYRNFLQEMRTYWSQKNYLFEERDHPREKPSRETLEEVLKRTRLLVTFSSTTAVDAAINGIPFYVHHPRSVVYKLRCNDIDGNFPSYELQREVLNEVAHAQWTLEEMESGKCWEHVRQLEKIKQI